LATLEQLTNLLFRLLIGTFADVIIPQNSLSIGQKQMRPILIIKSLSGGKIAIDRYRISDTALLHCPFDIADTTFRKQLGRMNTYHQ
jgi:hypothetical protein